MLVNKVCQFCKKEYAKKPSAAKNSKFCSRICHDKGKTYKNSKKQEARELRLSERLSINDISKRLNVPASTIAKLTKDIPLSQDERTKIRNQKLSDFHSQNWPTTNKALVKRLGITNCQIDGCTWVQTLELHHIDGDRNNNDPSNLQVLCPNHHSITPNFRNRKRIIDGSIDELV